jgi:flagellar protein FliO/FliZ
MELFLRVTFSLGAVVGLMWFLARIASRRMGGPQAAVVRLVGRQSLGRTASVAVVAVGERMLVVGVTEGGVRLLTEVDAEEVLTSTAAPLHAVDQAASASLAGTAPGVSGSTAATGLVPQGSVLSTQTWRQAWQAATSRGGSGR